MKPPYRADQVGSLLRPDALREVRARFKRGEVDAAALRAAEDSAIREAVARQESIGLESITDGEFRRDWWHLDFLGGFGGIEMIVNPGPKFKDTEEQPPIPSVTGKVRYVQPQMVDHFGFLKSITEKTAKMTIPSPSMVHLRGGRKSISQQVYPDIEEFFSDLSTAYRHAIRGFADAGCTYLQLDDTSFAYLCDDKFREGCRANGDDPATLPQTYARVINEALRDRPAGMAITMHTCRGNFKSTFVASGGYDPVAEAMFSTDLDGFFMEFDSDRSGTFDPLKYVQRGKKVVLGLVTTKFGQLEDKDTIKRRIDAASKVVPLEDLCLSPQCGFSSTYHGNALSVEEQWRKLERIVEVAREVWGTTA
jgi:5-methyltetrahydropteroyltriglutamate--homocysteine methyltransferase